MHIWGARGSLPAPGPHTIRYGGNTSCISISLDKSSTLVLDAGTGLAAMGQHAPRAPHTYYLLVSHVHWDHIQGLPLFAPLMCPRNRIVFLTEPDPDMGQQAMSQFDGLRFPLCREDIEADVRIDPRPVDHILSGLGIYVSWMQMNHTGTCTGFRIKGPSRSLVYMTDNELGNDYEGAAFSRFVAFAGGSDVLIHDAQFVEDERECRTGWGHSFLPDVCELAQRAQVGRLILFHHDYSRSDADIDRLCHKASSTLMPTTACSAAREGMTFDI